MAGRKKKAPGKVVDFTGRHELDELMGSKNIKKIKDPLMMELLVKINKTYSKKKKKLGGAVMKNRGGTFKGTY